MHDFLFNISLLGISGLWNGIKDALAAFLQLLYQFTVIINVPSYALAIVIFTVIVKFALYPLTVKQMRSMRSMQKIQPLIAALDKKYANNPQKKQEEMFRIYKENNVNPLSGCLPLLIQFPILIALYRTLYNFTPPEAVHYTFFWVQNLSMPDPTFVFPVLVGLATFFQQKFSITDINNPSQKVMLYAMPIFFGFISRSFPAALSIYWISFSLIGALQQYMVNKICDKQDLLAAEAQAQAEVENPSKKSKKPTELEKAIAAAKAEKEAKAKAKQDAKNKQVKDKLTKNDIFDGDHPYSRRKPNVVSTPEGVVYMDDQNEESLSSGITEMSESKPLSQEMKNKVKKDGTKHKLRKKK
ncbi:MAG: YidC/Oxa1 family membrane protein insertase [Bacillota bacterium]|jgi:YidC/Oxa1 family membrane protein insertase